MLEGRTIQQRLPKQYPPRAAQQLARSFADLMFAGNTKAALCLITEQNKGGVLSLDDLIHTSNSPPLTVKDVFESKHPPARPAFCAQSAHLPYTRMVPLVLQAWTLIAGGRCVPPMGEPPTSFVIPWLK